VTWLWTVAHAQINNRILELFNHVYTYATPECPNIVEINVTGGSRFFFTREPEHVKTILTSKFAEYGKGPEFHRVWVNFQDLYNHAGDTNLTDAGAFSGRLYLHDGPPTMARKPKPYSANVYQKSGQRLGHI
jgi:hypothetical protein